MHLDKFESIETTGNGINKGYYNFIYKANGVYNYVIKIYQLHEETMIVLEVIQI